MTTSPGPHSGDDTFDRIDGALAALAEPRGAWLGDDLAAMTPVAGLIGQAERLLPQLVHDARASRLSWREIAWAPVTSPDQARQRCDPESPVAGWQMALQLRAAGRRDQSATARQAGTRTQEEACTQPPGRFSSDHGRDRAALARSSSCLRRTSPPARSP